MRVAVTGHRKLSTQDGLRIKERLNALLEEGVTEFISGGALGLDTQALRHMYTWRAGRDIKLITVVPCTVDSQPSTVRSMIRCMSDQIIELGVPITAADGYRAYQVRNRYVVDMLTDTPDKLLSFFNGNEHSGTWSTMHYARKQSKTVEVIGLGP